MDDKDIKNIKKMLEHAKKVQDFAKDINNVEDYTNNNLVNSATLFEILQIGELVNNLSKECIDEINNIPWNKIYSMRNRIVHGYASVDYEIIYRTIQDDIPVLIKELNKY